MYVSTTKERARAAQPGVDGMTLRLSHDICNAVNASYVASEVEGAPECRRLLQIFLAIIRAARSKRDALDSKDHMIIG